MIPAAKKFSGAINSVLKANSEIPSGSKTLCRILHSICDNGLNPLSDKVCLKIPFIQSEIFSKLFAKPVI